MATKTDLNGRKPPKESVASVTQRRLVIGSFWLLFVLVGLPVWHRTTLVPRAQLPVSQMQAWSEGSACRVSIPVGVRIAAPHMDPAETKNLIAQTQQILDDSTDHSLHHLRLREHAAAENSLNISLTETGSTSFSHRLEGTTLFIDHPSKSSLAPHIAETLVDMFAEERGMIETIHQTPVFELEQQGIKSIPLYHITLSLFTATSTPADWDIDAAVDAFLHPILQALKPIANFTVDTQVQLHAKIASTPVFDNATQSYVLREQDLGAFVNAAEWPLSPSIGPGPTLHFVLYIPDPQTSPLSIENTRATSWTVPQWGGIFIMNNVQTLSVDQLRPAFSAFSRQLLGFLGLPKSPGSLDLRLSTSVRVRTASLMASAAATLGSVARLTASMSSIAIPDTVSVAVDETLDHLHGACAALRNGRHTDALIHAQAADLRAEKAFFEKSMVGQVYFPDEHKVAVYMPLLGPIGVPLITSALKEIRRFVQG